MATNSVQKRKEIEEEDEGRFKRARNQIHLECLLQEIDNKNLKSFEILLDLFSDSIGIYELRIMFVMIVRRYWREGYDLIGKHTLFVENYLIHDIPFCFSYEKDQKELTMEQEDFMRFSAFLNPSPTRIVAYIQHLPLFVLKKIYELNPQILDYYKTLTITKGERVYLPMSFVGLAAFTEDKEKLEWALSVYEHSMGSYIEEALSLAILNDTKEFVNILINHPKCPPLHEVMWTAAIVSDHETFKLLQSKTTFRGVDQWRTTFIGQANNDQVGHYLCLIAAFKNLNAIFQNDYGNEPSVGLFNCIETTSTE
jgi:hypothetical protein